MPVLVKREPRLNRRTLLRNALTGTGAVAVGLPLLEEMMLNSAMGASHAEVPVRAFNVFFGLGIPAPLQTEGFQGVLEPLKPLSDKLLIMRGVDQIRCDESGINAHFDGASGAFTAEPPDGEAKAGGPSIDQVVRHSHYTEGLPAGMVSTLVAGTFFRRSRVSRYVHSYNPDGTVAATMQESPRDLFERVFGTIGQDESGAAEKRLKRSVLDSVVGQYKLLTRKDSPLGAASRGRVADHLDRVREFEQRAYAMQRPEGAPDLPPDSHLLHGGAADPGGEGIDITLDELVQEWRLLAELYALAIEMDRTRFGAITFLAAGERIRLTGKYSYEGRHIYDFNDQQELGASGSGGCSHEWWHRFHPKKDNQQLRAHAHLKMREVAYFLSLLDGINDANGKSALENALITISTESGDGRHNDVKRELSGVFHAVSGAGGRLKTGQIMDVGQEGLDVYNTILSTFNSPKDASKNSKQRTVANRMGPTKRDSQLVESILS